MESLCKMTSYCLHGQLGKSVEQGTACLLLSNIFHFSTCQMIQFWPQSKLYSTWKLNWHRSQSFCQRTWLTFGQIVEDYAAKCSALNLQVWPNNLGFVCHLRYIIVIWEVLSSCFGQLTGLVVVGSDSYWEIVINLNHRGKWLGICRHWLWLVCHLPSPLGQNPFHWG